jgi:pimeloyl-ACP methyl ester carboxylesterase
MKRRSLIVTLLIVAAVVAFGSGQVRTRVPLPAELKGELDGATYRISVPANWNGTLLVYAHGYGEYVSPPALAPSSADVTTLSNQGYALAASTFPGTGWTVKEGMQSTAALTSLFRDTVGRPQKTIVWGRSMGGLMTLGMIEKFPGLYDGAVSLCSPAAGTTRRFDQALDIALAYAVAFGWPDTWGTPGDIRDDINFSTEVQPHIVARMTPAQKGRWEFIRLVNGLPVNLTVANSYYMANLRALNMYFAVAVRAEIERRAGGPIAENVGRVYTMTDAEKAYLENLGVGDVDELLERMNVQANFAADRDARNYVEHYVDPTGRIRRPVLTVHVTDDALAVPNHASAYRDVVEQAGNADLLVQQFTNGVGHCAFTTGQDVASIAAMVYWLETGNRPPGSLFTAPGFDSNYVPPPWRW